MPTKPTTKKSKTTKAAKEKKQAAKISVAEKPKKAEVLPLEEETVVVAEPALKPKKPAAVGPEKYYESVGRRKEAVARVRVFTKKSTDVQESDDKALIIVNGKLYQEYFRPQDLRNVVEAPLRKLKSLNRFKATVKVSGGGMRGQADAVKLGISRGLVLFDSNFSKKLRKAGYLTRDARVKERRKYGLKKARKAPQWAKR